MSNAAMLCHCSRPVDGGRLCFCVGEGSDAGKLVFKREMSNVYVIWYAPNKDLDICAYWLGNPDGKLGWGWGRLSENENYYLRWYGDNTDVGGNEHLLTQIKPSLEADVNHVLRIHLNYYGKSVTGTCTVKAVFSDGSGEMARDGVLCSGHRGEKAKVTDSYVDILFDAEGKAVSITQE